MIENPRVLPEKFKLPIIKNEIELGVYLSENWNREFPRLHLIGFNYPVYGCITSKKIGLVDIVFSSKNKRRERKYCVEIKYSESAPTDFWGSLKILGYVEAMRMHKFNDDVMPVIMINKERLNYDYRAILVSLRIGYITFSLDADNRLLGFDKNF